MYSFGSAKTRKDFFYFCETLTQICEPHYLPVKVTARTSVREPYFQATFLVCGIHSSEPQSPVSDIHILQESFQRLFFEQYRRQPQ